MQILRPTQKAGMCLYNKTFGFVKACYRENIALYLQWLFEKVFSVKGKHLKKCGYNEDNRKKNNIIDLQQFFDVSYNNLKNVDTCFVSIFCKNIITLNYT